MVVFPVLTENVGLPVATAAGGGDLRWMRRVNERSRRRRGERRGLEILLGS